MAIQNKSLQTASTQVISREAIASAHAPVGFVRAEGCLSYGEVKLSKEDSSLLMRGLGMVRSALQVHDAEHKLVRDYITEGSVPFAALLSIPEREQENTDNHRATFGEEALRSIRALTGNAKLETSECKGIFDAARKFAEMMGNKSYKAGTPDATPSNKDVRDQLPVVCAAYAKRAGK
jgi:hypothetical protein